jgi:DNA-binding response OmpR family regulator
MSLSESEKCMISATYKPTVMIVDDEMNFAESLQLAIEDEFSVTLAPSLECAREMLEKSMPAAILLDLRLPDGEGIELLHTLNEFGQQPVVIVMTAFAELDSYIKTRIEGATDYFPKPLDIVKLKKVLRTELRNKNSIQIS